MTEITPKDSVMRGFGQQLLNNAVLGELNPFVDDHDGADHSKRRRGEAVADVFTIVAGGVGVAKGVQAFRAIAANPATQFGAQALAKGPGMGIARWAGVAAAALGGAYVLTAIKDLVRGGADPIPEPMPDPSPPKDAPPDDAPPKGDTPGYESPRHPKGRGDQPEDPKQGPEAPKRPSPSEWFDEPTQVPGQSPEQKQPAPSPDDVTQGDDGVKDHGKDSPPPGVGQAPDKGGVEQAPEKGDTCEPCPDDPCIPNTYVVKKGDSLSKIAAKWGMDWKQLYWLNRDQIDHPDLIYPGQKFVVPQCPIEVPDFPYTPLNPPCDPPKSPPKGDPDPPKVQDPEPPKGDPDPPKAQDPEPPKGQPDPPKDTPKQDPPRDVPRQEPPKDTPKQEPTQEPTQTPTQTPAQTPSQSPLQAPVQSP